MTLLPWDLVLGLVGVLLTLSVLPTAINKKSRVPLIGSLPLVVGLSVYTVGFTDLGLYFSAGTTALQSILWAFIGMKRRVVSENKNSEVQKSGIELPMAPLPCSHDCCCQPYSDQITGDSLQ